MVKEGEINYLRNIGKEGIKHASRKPFSDNNCGPALSQIGAIFSLIPEPPKKLLDVGCGTGWTSIFFAKRGYDVLGIDISPDMVNIALKNAKKENIKNIIFKVKDYENINFKENYDIIIFHDSFHHAINEKKALEGAYKSLRNGGVCLLSEPGYGHSNALASIRAVSKYNVTEKDVPPFYIIGLAKEIGFKFKLYPRGDVVNNILYSNYIKSSKIRLIMRLFPYNLAAFLILSLILVFYKKRDGIVVLTK